VSRMRGGLSAALAMAFAAAGTTWVATFAWRGFTDGSGRYLGPLLVLGAVVAVTGAVARWARVAAPLVVLLQVALAAMMASLMFSGSPIPVGAAWVRLNETFTDAADVAQRFAAPVPSYVDGGVYPLLIAGGLACLLLVDFLACTLNRVPLAGLPLLTIYSVPVSMLAGGGVSWWVFALTAGGFLLMLFLQMNEQLIRWGRPLGSEESSDPAGFSVRTGAVRTTAGTIGGVSTALAVILPVFVPTLGLAVFPGGNGAGGDNIRIENPMANLRRDLRRGDDIPLMRVRTSDPDPSYLRISVLNRFSENEWSSGDRDVPTDQLASGQMPPLVGVSDSVPRTEARYEISINDDFESIWLPTQSPISQIEAPGDWRYDLSTMDFLSGDQDLTTEDIRYSMTGVKLNLSAEAMARAPATAGQVSDDFTDLPTELPEMVRGLTLEVTKDARTRFEKAQALQEWFRSSGGFTYDLTADQGNGTNDLVRFLSNGEGGRTGYCEQFASAMAVMARVVGIPARVAVGFLNPEQIEPETWEYSAWDLHAWPELFFPGSGWVRFEPTPAGRASGVPDYTTQHVPQIDVPNEATGPSGSNLLPSRGPSVGAAPSDSAGDNGADGDQSGFPWLPVTGGTAGGLLVVGLLLLPRTLRRRRSHARVGAGPEAAWLELRDTAIDLRLPWPADRSPRETRDRLVDHFGAPVDHDTPERPRHGADVAPEAVTALDGIVLALERLRYSRGHEPADPGALRSELETVVAALHGGATRGARRRAAWWPRSVLSRRRSVRRSPLSAPINARHGGVVDHVG
jgi:transglutaminase-like putative cysteine protease